MAVGLSSIILGAAAQLTFFTGRSFASLFNYTDLDLYSRNALDTMSRDIRQAQYVTNATSTSVTFQDWDNTPLQYSWDPNALTLSRIKAGQNQVLLVNCVYLNFALYQRNPVGGTYDQYPAATPGTCKLVQVTWVCARQILGFNVNTESVQSARFVIRKE